jgi:hypothetical protein
MRFIRFLSVAGFTAVLLGSTGTPTSIAAPGRQVVVPGWTVFEQPLWDPTGAWYTRTIVIRPTAVAVAEAVPVTTVTTVPVTVVARTGVVENFSEATFSTLFQEIILPTVASVIPLDTLGSGIQAIQVRPGLHALVAPQLFCSLDTAAVCEALAREFAERTPGWTTVTINGPLGYGVYLAFMA